MQRISLEKHQSWVYLAAIFAGIATGRAFPGLGLVFEAMLWPALGFLLFAAFTQLPLLQLRIALGDRRFMLANLIGQFVMLPGLVWLMVLALPADPALRLGVLLVLLVPCTDWFLSFSQLGRGDLPRALAITPINLLAQLGLLPVYLWLMLEPSALPDLGAVQAWPGILLIALSLGAAVAARHWATSTVDREPWLERAAWLPVPLLAGVIFLIAASQYEAMWDMGNLLPVLLPLFVAFLLAAALLAKGMQLALGLPPAQGRTLAFGFGTRNSFVVLPLALALPAGWEVAAAVIVVQSVVELLGMLVFLRWIPNRLFPDLR